MQVYRAGTTGVRFPDCADIGICQAFFFNSQIVNLQDDLALPYHQGILNDEVPLSIGGGIGQARTYMYILRTAHLGEVTVTVWPDDLKKICAEKNIHVLE